MNEKKRKGSKNEVRFVHAVALIPDDVLSRGDMHVVYDENNDSN